MAKSIPLTVVKTNGGLSNDRNYLTSSLVSRCFPVGLNRAVSEINFQRMQESNNFSNRVDQVACFHVQLHPIAAPYRTQHLPETLASSVGICIATP